MQHPFGGALSGTSFATRGLATRLFQALGAARGPAKGLRDTFRAARDRAISLFVSFRAARRPARSLFVTSHAARGPAKSLFVPTAPPWPRRDRRYWDGGTHSAEGQRWMGFLADQNPEGPIITRLRSVGHVLAVLSERARDPSPILILAARGSRLVGLLASALVRMPIAWVPVPG